MGSAKHLIPVDGTPLVERLHRAIAPFCEQVFLLGRGAVPRSLRTLRRVADTRGRRGPLAGITAAFRCQPDRAWLIVACDMPHVDSYALDWLVGQRRQGRSAVIPRIEGRRAEPLLAIYEPTAREYLEWLARQNRGPADMANCATAHEPIVQGWIARAWKNVNTPEELEACVAKSTC